MFYLFMTSRMLDCRFILALIIINYIGYDAYVNNRPYIRDAQPLFYFLRFLFSNSYIHRTIETPQLARVD